MIDVTTALSVITVAGGHSHRPVRTTGVSCWSVTLPATTVVPSAPPHKFLDTGCPPRRCLYAHLTLVAVTEAAFCARRLVLLASRSVRGVYRRGDSDGLTRLQQQLVMM